MVALNLGKNGQIHQSFLCLVICRHTIQMIEDILTFHLYIFRTMHKRLVKYNNDDDNYNNKTNIDMSGIIRNFVDQS